VSLPPDPPPFRPVALPVRGGGAVRLRPATAGDAEAWAAHVAADLGHLGEHLPWPAATAEPAGAAAFIGRYLHREGGRALLLVLEDDGGRLVGGTVLMTHDPRTRSIELGTWVVLGLEGRGVVRAACRATIAHARRALDVHRVVWTAASGNARSRALAERLGFVHEGTLRDAGLHDGRRQDLDVLSLVGPEIDRALAADG
jgi:RimJ/RimL family protein N-acetyltransferase